MWNLGTVRRCNETAIAKWCWQFLPCDTDSIPLILILIRRLPNFVKTLHAEGDRIFVGDLQESFHFMRYKKADNALYVYADDIVPRHLTSALPLDYDTVAGADKFGNFVVMRLPAAVSAQVKADCSGDWLTHGQGLQCRTRHRVNFAMHTEIRQRLADTVDRLNGVRLLASSPV